MDPYEQELEIIESNNTTAGDQIAFGYDPDLVVTAIDGPATAVSGPSFAVAMTVCNQGQGPSYGTDVRLYLSADSTITETDYLSASEYLGFLDVGQCTTVNAQAFGIYVPGVYTLGAIVDQDGMVDELLEGNNTTVGSAIGIGNDPDLVITSVDAPASALPGSNLQVDVTVCNQGQSASYSTYLEVYASDDAVIDMNDMPLGWVPVGYLDVGMCTTAQVSGPGAMVEGTQTIIGRVDPAEMVIEINENNNVNAESTVVFGDDADLWITDVSAPASVMMGQPFNIDVTVCNQGPDNLAPVHPAPVLAVYLSADTAITSDDEQVGSNPSSFGLSAGQCTVIAVSAMANQPGQWVVGAIADEMNWVVELDESNNSTAGSAIDVL